MTKSTPTLTQSGLLAVLLQRQRYRVFHLARRSAHRKRVQAAFWNTHTWARRRRRQRWSTGGPTLESFTKPIAMSHQIHTYTDCDVNSNADIKTYSNPERNTMRTDTERVLTVLLALALALLTITTFALARAQQRYTAAQWYQAK